jgi:hypothetical protein
MRKVIGKDVFSSYLGVECRFIVLDGEICTNFKTNSGRKNWWMKSVHRDDEIRSLI